MRFFMILVLFFCMSAITAETQAQSKKEKKKKKQTENAEKDNSFSPFTPAASAVENQSAKSSRKARKGKKKDKSFADIFNKRMEDKKTEFRRRMKANAKQDRKEARLAQKPKYSDPLYFGHKKKPKKRKPGKRKFCKECGIVH